MVVDLREVTFMDSTGLGVLVQARRIARAHQRTYVLVSTSTAAAQPFRVTGMQHVMPLHPDVETALGSPGARGQADGRPAAVGPCDDHRWEPAHASRARG